jgi:hypothetical protein
VSPGSLTISAHAPQPLGGSTGSGAVPSQTPVADQVSVSTRGHQMTARQQRAQRGVNPSGISLDNVGVSPGVDSVMVLDTVIQDDFARRRADELDAEVAYYRHRSIQEERVLGPGYYVDLLWGMAADRAAMAQRIRTGNGAARDPARRRVPQMPSQVPVCNSQSTDRHLGHDRGR